MNFYAHEVIELKQQPTPDTCVSTCLAMLLNEDTQTIIDQFHASYKAGQTNPIKFLEQRGIKVNDGKPYQYLDEDGLYFLMVPSLNIQATNHQIIYIIEEGGNGWFHTLLDPVKGREGKLYYKSDFEQDDNELSVKLKGFAVDFFIDIETAKKILTGQQL